jgi:NADH:ubiquinone oxidoreductase subunit 5 (subunit L)/multisubunit Na+/H+ antiporter MnhA subunit
MPVAVAAVALTTGLAAATFVKAFGTGFLAQPRSAEAEAAKESPPTMLVGMGLLAIGCVALGIFPTLVGPALSGALGSIRLGDGVPLAADGARLVLAGIQSTISPLLLAAGLVAGVFVALGAVRALGGRPRPRLAASWGCGRSVQTPRMEYTATSYAEPLMRVFDDVLRPDRDLDVSHSSESRYFVESVRFHTGIRDAVEDRVYTPLIRAVNVWGLKARIVQAGSVHRYLTYGLVALIVLLLVSR